MGENTMNDSLIVKLRDHERHAAHDGDDDCLAAATALEYQADCGLQLIEIAATLATYGRICHKTERVPDVVKEVLRRMNNDIQELSHE